MKTLFVFIAVVSGTAFAQYFPEYDDEPIPFDYEAPDEPLPIRQQPADTDDFSGYVGYEETTFQSLARQDDPSVGLSFDIHGGLIWLDESKKGTTFRFVLGARLTWEWSRTFLDDEYWRKVFFVDLTWNMTKATTGTELVYTKVTNNYLVLAPAWALPIAKSPFAFFVQCGIGLFVLHSRLVVENPTAINLSNTGAFLLGQYAAGFRARISPDPKEAFFLAFRVEFTGYIHRHAHDMMLSASVGIGF